jgi:hypothetical protein
MTRLNNEPAEPASITPDDSPVYIWRVIMTSEVFVGLPMDTLKQVSRFFLEKDNDPMTQP